MDLIYTFLSCYLSCLSSVVPCCFSWWINYFIFLFLLLFWWQRMEMVKIRYGDDFFHHKLTKLCPLTLKALSSPIPCAISSRSDCPEKMNIRFLSNSHHDSENLCYPHMVFGRQWRWVRPTYLHVKFLCRWTTRGWGWGMRAYPLPLHAIS